MNVPVKSASGITTMPIESKFISERIIFIEGEITQESALKTCKEILFLAMTDKDQPIDIIINSHGGEVNAGLMILDFISNSIAEIHTWCWSVAYSMAALLFASGKKRYMLEHAELMLHQPLIASHIGGNVSAIKAVSESLITTSQKLNELLASCTGKTIDEIETITRTDHYFSANEAVKFGLADEITTIDKIIRKDMQ